MDHQKAQEQFAQLRKAIEQAKLLENLDGNTYQLHVTQLVAKLQKKSVKASNEIERLKREIAVQEGHIEANEAAIGLLVGIIVAHNSLITKEAEARKEAERTAEEERETEDKKPATKRKGKAKK